MAFGFDPLVSLVAADYFSEMVYGEADYTANPTCTAIVKANIERLVNAASQAILTYIGRNIIEADYVEVWDGQGSDTLIPREYPITAVSAIKFSGTGNFSTVTAIDPLNYQLQPEFITFRYSRTPRGAGSVQVAYTAGYAEIPADLMAACILQFQFLLKQINPGGKGSAPMVGVSSIGKQGETTTKDPNIAKYGLTAEVIGHIQKYRRMDAPLSVAFARVS